MNGMSAVTSSPDVLVVGAGVTGLATAIALAEAGLAVEVLDRGPVARESTWAGAGILSLLLPWHYPEPVTALAERGRRLWPEWIARLQALTGLDPEYRVSGMLVAGTAEAEAARAWGRRQGWRVGPPPSDLVGACPAAAEGLWLPEVAQVRNPRLARLLECAARLGVCIRPHTPVTALEVAGGRIAGVLTAGGRIACERVVVCAGAWSRELLAALAGGVEIRPVRGQILMLEASPGLLPCIVYREGRYLVPRSDGRVLVGSTLEEVGFARSTTPEAGAQLHAFARITCPALSRARVVRQWAGLRPGSPGNLPVIAPHPRLANLYMNAGHFRYGLTMAPAAAELLTALILGRTPALEVAPYAWPGEWEVGTGGAPAPQEN